MGALLIFVNVFNFLALLYLLAINSNYYLTIYQYPKSLTLKKIQEKI